jgi:hypothetical protein
MEKSRVRMNLFDFARKIYMYLATDRKKQHCPWHDHWNSNQKIEHHENIFYLDADAVAYVRRDQHIRAEKENTSGRSAWSEILQRSG